MEAQKKKMFFLKEPVVVIDPQTKKEKTNWVTVGRMFHQEGKKGEKESYNILLDQEVKITGDRLYVYPIPVKKVQNEGVKDQKV
ncbi:MAG: hypothetical protein COX62_08860 [Deltaproteobacteria bacterium CG_4_10_14_0_2_um_filter_43_8]|nr:MAG: hypothetical protein COV43_07800 [Deltaproteobacteria bacterium CG11_big_fil_rev_8_21_14_0_20_42_23]PJA18310.1 MAG: hypothetical protein COX62_08860 [Deltaproteobacteria bacterium CG_4_10_14_0_2_um_filter_43_8]PJC63455.1 MAG: hypothetical protein CO021_09420 [Deltaproteobacteria bacterium CG_4_9_14_0_2_um_filter_42_21]